jgi:hypothetical protein
MYPGKKTFGIGVLSLFQNEHIYELGLLEISSIKFNS